MPSVNEYLGQLHSQSCCCSVYRDAHPQNTIFGTQTHHSYLWQKKRTEPICTKISLPIPIHSEHSSCTTAAIQHMSRQISEPSLRTAGLSHTRGHISPHPAVGRKDSCRCVTLLHHIPIDCSMVPEPLRHSKAGVPVSKSKFSPSSVPT